MTNFKIYDGYKTFFKFVVSGSSPVTNNPIHCGSTFNADIQCRIYINNNSTLI